MKNKKQNRRRAALLITFSLIITALPSAFTETVSAQIIQSRQETEGYSGNQPEQPIFPTVTEQSVAEQPVPETEPTPEITAAPELTEIPESTQSLKHTETPAVTETPESIEAPEVTETPEPTGTPASDLIISQNKKLTENLICGNLTISAGTLDLNGHSILVQGELSLCGGYLATAKGNLTVEKNILIQSTYSTFYVNGGITHTRGNFIIENGQLNLDNEGKLSIDQNLQVGKQGSINLYRYGESELDIHGNMDIYSEKASFWYDGTIRLEGNLTQHEEAGETSLQTESSLVLQFTGQTGQTVSLSHPESTYIGKIDAQASAGVTFQNQIRCGMLQGISHIQNEKELVLESGIARLQQDEQINCDLVLINGCCYTNGYNLNVRGNLSVQETGGKLGVDGGTAKVTGNLSIEAGQLSLSSKGKIETDGSLQIGKQGRIDMSRYGETELHIHGDLDILSEINSFWYDGTIKLEGNLTQHEEAGETSLQTENSLILQFTGQTGQTVSLSHPESTYIGKIDAQASAGVTFQNQIRCGTLQGISHIQNEKELVLESGIARLQQDEQINSDLVLINGCCYTSGYNLTVRGKISIQGMGGRLGVDGGAARVMGSLTIEAGELSLSSRGKLEIGDNLQLGNQGRINMVCYGGTELAIHGNMDIYSERPSFWNDGIIKLEGNLTQQEGAGETSLQTETSLTLQFIGQTAQTVSLSHPETTYIGKIDAQASTGVTFQNQIRCGSLQGISRIQNEKELVLESGNINLQQDEQINSNLVIGEGSCSTNGHTLSVNGNIYIKKANGKLYADRGSIQISEGLYIEQGELILRQQGKVGIGKDLQIGNQGKVTMAYQGGTNLDIQGNLDIYSEKASFWYDGTIKLKGDLTQYGCASEKSLDLRENVTLQFTGEQTQTVRLAHTSNLGYIELQKSSGVNFRQDIDGKILTGLEKIIQAGGKEIHCDYIELLGDATIDGDLLLKGNLNLNDHVITINGNLEQHGNIDISKGKLLVQKNLLMAKGQLNLGSGTVQTGDNTTIQKAASLRMDNSSHLLVKGDFKISSSSSGSCLLSNGTLEIKGNLIQTKAGISSNLAGYGGFQILLSGSEKQTVTLHGTGVPIEINNIDLSQSSGVEFKQDLRIRKLKGWEKIKNQTLCVTDSQISMENDETFSGDLLLINTSINLNKNTFHVTGNLEQANSIIDLYEGILWVEKDYAISGESILWMIYAKDLVRVGGSFSTESTLGHEGWLKNGTFYLAGDFSQSGDKSSFCATENHTMVFHGEKIQKVKFDDKENSHFANVNITGAGIEEEPESLFVMTWRTIKSVGEGIEEALTEVKESLDSPEELATMAGITAASIAVPGVGIVLAGFVALSMSAEIIQNTASEGDRYTKAKEYAREATHILLLIGMVKGTEALQEALNSRSTLSDAMKRLTKDNGGFVDTDMAGFLLKSETEQREICLRYLSEEVQSVFTESGLFHTIDLSVLYETMRGVEGKGAITQIMAEGMLKKLANSEPTVESLTKWLENTWNASWRSSECSYEELYNYLKKVNRSYAKGWEESGVWPEGVRVPMDQAGLKGNWWIEGGLKSGKDLIKNISKIEYGSDELSKVAIEFRKANNITSARRNVCAIEYRNTDGTIVKKAFVSNASNHSEELMIDFLKGDNILGEDVIRIFSEREPCVETATNVGHNCTSHIMEYTPDAEVTYAVDYGVAQEDGLSARNTLEELLDKLLD